MMIKLNADLGESFGSWRMQNDVALMPFIDMANIACGGHAGDPVSMLEAIKLSRHYSVALGAHPSYPDLQGFGRRSMQMGEQELIAHIQGQVSTLDGLAKSSEQSLTHIKPHGALYNDAMKQEHTRIAIYKAVSEFHTPLPLILQATQMNELIREEAKSYGLVVYFEAFADRAYQDNGLLVSRTSENAVLGQQAAISQAKTMIEQGIVISVSGKSLMLEFDTICVHGDTDAAVEQVKAIRHLLDAC